MAFTPRFICGNGNFPRREVLTNEYLQVIVSLHNANPIQPHGIDRSLASELLTEGLLTSRADGSIFNNAMVIRISDGQELLALARRHSHFVQEIIERHLDSIKAETSIITEFHGQPFISYSFFILSNVVLDNWQIRNIEDLYLKQERPLRGGKKFYVAIMEDSPNGKDPFGIYGNISRAAQSASCCFYGNNQKSLKPMDFEELLLRNDALTLSQDAGQALTKVAAIVRDDLIRFFKGIDEKLRKYHSESPWADIAYAEFFIWWYHFLYTQVTNELAKNRELTIPKGGMFPYIIKGEQ